MIIEVLKSKIHRVTVTGADINYIGSISIDKLLIEAANLVIGEKVHILNINNEYLNDQISKINFQC